ncbi:hypothetical protein GGI42DRAFT_311769 [Trichoderma sp. SZMC 28013]
MSAGYKIQYGYQGCYIANPDGNLEFGPDVAQKILTTSEYDCTSFCSSQSTGSTLYFSLGTNSTKESVCTCGNVITSNDYRHVGVYFLCSSPYRLSGTAGYMIYCGGQFGEDQLLSMFAAI